MDRIWTVENIRIFQVRGVLLYPPPTFMGGGEKKRIIMIMIFHKYLWLVWYEGMIVETNGDQIPGAILSFMEEYLV